MPIGRVKQLVRAPRGSNGGESSERGMTLLAPDRRDLTGKETNRARG